MKLKLWSKPISRDELERRLRNRAAVSPGKPTMKSDETLMSGRTSRSRRIFCLYSRIVCLRFISASTRSEPLCTGRCRWFASLGTSRYASINGSRNSSGCEVVKRMRSMPSHLGDETDQRREVRALPVRRAAAIRS